MALILPLWFAIGTARIADAHAVLESSSPADQSVLAHSPPRVTLTFGEDVTLTVGSLRVFDPAGKRVDEGVPTHGATGHQVTVRLKPDLPRGSYAVAWRVISADTHPVHGGFVFSVGSKTSVGGVDQYLKQSSQPGWEAVGDALRSIAYLGSFIVVGAAIFTAFAGRIDLGRTQRLRSGLALVGIVALVAEVLQLPVAATLATGEGLGSLFDPGVPAQVLGQGTWLTIVGLALAVVTASAAQMVDGVARRAWALVSLALLAAAFVLSGHSRTTDPPWLAGIVDAVHVAGGAVWVGGLAVLVVIVRAMRRRREELDAQGAAAAVVAFSRLATVSIVAVGVAGGVLAWFEVGSWSGLFTTGYGLLVVAKIALVCVLAAIGAFNHFRLVPAVNKRPDRAAGWRYLHSTVRLEALALVAVLGVTGVLVNGIPSRTEAQRQALFSASVQLGDGSVNLIIDPARTGPTELHLYILDAHGRPDDHEQSAEVDLTQPKLGIGPITRSLHRAGPGHFLTSGTMFTVPGTWTVTFRIRVDEFTERSAVVHVKVRS